jgi:predicted CopG family antitoxin
MKKDIRKTVRLSEDEHEKLVKMLQQNDVSFSDYARARLLNYQIKSKHDITFLYELNKIGNNLNQIAKAVNSHDDSIQILTKLVEIEKALKDLK